MDSGPHLRVVQGGTAVNLPVEPIDEPVRRKRAYVPVELPEEEFVFDETMLAGLILGLLLLIPLAILAFHEVKEKVEDVLEAIVEVQIVEPEATPEPTPEPEPEPEPEIVDLDQLPMLPTNVAVEEPPEPPKPVFGLSMESTVEANSSGVSIAVGNTLMKEPDPIVPPDEVKPLREVSFARLEEAPVILKDYRAEYPDVPKAEGIQGTVMLKLTIDENGDVSEVRVVRGVHPELDAAAKAAAFRFKFKPGKSGGEAVITRGYVYRYTWVITE